MTRHVIALAARGSVTLAAFGLLGALATSARAEALTPTDKEIADSIRPLDLGVAPLDLGVVPFELEIKPLALETVDGAEKVVTLNSDILFNFDKATIAPVAATKIGESVTGLAKGAEVRVGGHTDSLGTDARNLTLSQQRAATVAAAIKAVRGDLVLTVKGFGEARPVASNGSPGKDDTQGRSKNRRVEIRFAG